MSLFSGPEGRGVWFEVIETRSGTPRYKTLSFLERPAVGSGEKNSFGYTHQRVVEGMAGGLVSDGGSYSDTPIIRCFSYGVQKLMRSMTVLLRQVGICTNAAFFRNTLVGTQQCAVPDVSGELCKS